MTDDISDAEIEAVARAICKSRSCKGVSCCEWPANTGERHKCTVIAGFSDAARTAILASRAALLAEGRKVTPREPSHKAVTAGLMHGFTKEDGLSAYPVRLWRAMWDAAL